MKPEMMPMMPMMKPEMMPMMKPEMMMKHKPMMKKGGY
jgi:hypothetical protein